MAEVDSSGKSYFVFQRAVFKSLLEPNRKTLVLRKTAVNCRRSCFEDMKRTLSQFKITKYCKINQTTMEITLPNNSKFLFMGLDNFEDIKSIPDIHDIIIEECSEITYDDFSELKGRTRGRGKLKNQIVMMMNPVSKLNWTYKHFFYFLCNEEDCLMKYENATVCYDDESLKKQADQKYLEFIIQLEKLGVEIIENNVTIESNHLDKQLKKVSKHTSNPTTLPPTTPPSSYSSSISSRQSISSISSKSSSNRYDTSSTQSKYSKPYTRSPSQRTRQKRKYITRKPRIESNPLYPVAMSRRRNYTFHYPMGSTSFKREARINLLNTTNRGICEEGLCIKYISIHEVPYDYSTNCIDIHSI